MMAPQRPLGPLIVGFAPASKVAVAPSEHLVRMLGPPLRDGTRGNHTSTEE